MARVLGDQKMDSDPKGLGSQMDGCEPGTYPKFPGKTRISLTQLSHLETHNKQSSVAAISTLDIFKDLVFCDVN